MNRLTPLFAEVDRIGGKVTFVHLTRGGWKAIVSGVGLPPHQGVGSTAADALEEVLRFARTIGASKR